MAKQNDYTDEDLLVLEHYAHLWAYAKEWEAGQHVEIPSPAIEGRIDQAVVMFGHGPGQDASAFIIRNRGRYSATKSRALSERLSALLSECQLSPSSSCPAYLPGDRSYLDGDADSQGTWVFCTRHRTAPRRLSEARKALKQAEPESTPKKQRRSFGSKG